MPRFALTRPSGWWGEFVDAARFPPDMGECELRVDREARTIALRSGMGQTRQFGPATPFDLDGWYSVTDAVGRTVELSLDVSDAETNAVLVIRFHGSTEPQPAAS